MKQLILKILTPVGTAFEGSVDAVYVPGSAGRFEILPDHAPIVSSLTGGELAWKEGEKLSSFSLRSGAIILTDNKITVCAEPVE